MSRTKTKRALKGDSVQPRKKPVQNRSRSTYDRILQATLELIQQEGYLHISTNKIIERSGISPGSLYQYFPNREAIFLALYEDISTKATNDVKAVMVRYLDADLDTAVRGIFDALLAAYEGQELVLLRFIEELPELADDAHIVSFRTSIHSSVRSFIQLHADEFEYADLERATYFVQNTVLENIRHFVLTQPSHTDREEFIEDLTRIITRYLQRAS